MFNLSCADFAFPLVPHDVSLYLISKIGCKGVDVGLFENRSHLQPSDQFIDVKKSALQLKDRLQHYNLAPSDVFLQAELDMTVYAANHIDANRRRHARDLYLKALEYAQYLECGHLSALPGVTFPEEEYEASFARCVEEHMWRVEEAKKAGIAFGVEAHVGSVVNTTDKAMALLQSTPGLTLTLDYSHFVRQKEPDEAADKLLPYASHFHARGARSGHLQTSLAENEIDFARVLRKLAAIGYEHWICVEYAWTPNWEDCGRNDNISETVLTKRHLEEIIANLHH